MFTTSHFIWIFLIAAVVAIMLIWGNDRLTLRSASYIMAGICFVSETSKMMSWMIDSPFGGKILSPKALPFHLCSLMLFGVMYITFGKNQAKKQWVMDFLAVAGTLGSICAILIPTEGSSFTNILSYQCFVYHGGLLWFATYLIASGNAHLGWKSWRRNLGFMFGLLIAMTYVNSFLSAYGTNFMFIVRPPMEGLPYLNLNKGWYVYFLRLIVLGFTLVTLFQLPFLIKEHKKKQ